MINSKYTYFHKEKEKNGEFSQWYRDFDNPQTPQFTCPETGISFNCAEQWMMFQKAVFFDDFKIADKILTEYHPNKQKELGRKVMNFNKEKRETQDVEVVTQGSYLKYSQNKNLLIALLETDGTTLVEASPRDTIWGIGLSAKDPRSRVKSHRLWKNKLGYILTEIRDNFKANENYRTKKH